MFNEVSVKKGRNKRSMYTAIKNIKEIKNDLIKDMEETISLIKEEEERFSSIKNEEGRQIIVKIYMNMENTFDDCTLALMGQIPQKTGDWYSDCINSIKSFYERLLDFISYLIDFADRRAGADKLLKDIGGTQANINKYINCRFTSLPDSAIIDGSTICRVLNGKRRGHNQWEIINASIYAQSIKLPPDKVETEDSREKLSDLIEPAKVQLNEFRLNICKEFFAKFFDYEPTPEELESFFAGFIKYYEEKDLHYKI